MAVEIININYPGGYQDVRCSEKDGRERCTGCAMVPVTMLQKAQLRAGTVPVNGTFIKFPSVKFTCGHVHTVKVCA